MTQEKPKIRLYVPKEFHAGHGLTLNIGQSHYLAHVMRCGQGDPIAVFNGRDGEWLALVTTLQKKSVTLTLAHPLAEQRHSPDLWLVFAPPKNKVDIVTEKAVELGVSALHVVYTQHTMVRSINMDKLNAHAVEAAEQSGRHDVPPIEEHKDLGTLLSAWPRDRTLLYGDESGGGTLLKTLLNSLSPCGRGSGRGGLLSYKDTPHPVSLREPPSPTRGEGEKYAMLIGPEGGFSFEEHRLLKAAPLVRAFGMGPRILRADTAAVAALACVQAWLGDWDESPRFEAGS